MAILSETPLFNNAYTTFSEAEIWENYNSVVDKLNEVSKKDYSKFKVEPKWDDWGDGSGQYVVNGTLFRQKLNGLINHLHAEFFPTERAPFSGEPTHVFEQNQTVSQNTEVQVLMMTVLEVQEKLIKQEGIYPEDSKESKFIKKLKDALKGVKSNIDLINTILQTAMTVGITLDSLHKIFK